MYRIVQHDVNPHGTYILHCARQGKPSWKSVPENMQISWKSNFNFSRDVMEFSQLTFHYCKSFAYELHFQSFCLSK